MASVTSPAGVRRGYVDVPGGQVHYRICDEADGVPLVLLHQTASSSQMFVELMGELAGELPTIALDVPGYGQSDPVDGPISTAAYGELLLAALRGLGVERAWLAGHHSGAMIAAELATTDPERCAGVILMSPWYKDAAERAAYVAPALVPMQIEPDGAHLVQMWERLRTYAPGSELELCHRETVDSLLAGPRVHETYAALGEQDWLAICAALTCPVLVLTGEHDVVASDFGAICDAIPQARGVLLPGGALWVVDERPADVAHELRAFFAGGG